jgi:SET and MYND domain-containing protein
VRAIALAELGKLLAVDEPAPAFGAAPSEHQSTDKASLADSLPSGPARLKLALSTLQQAYNELSIAFGSSTGGGSVGNEVREATVRLEKELRVWNNGVRDAVRDAALARRL